MISYRRIFFIAYVALFAEVGLRLLSSVPQHGPPANLYGSSQGVAHDSLCALSNELEALTVYEQTHADFTFESYPTLFTALKLNVSEEPFWPLQRGVKDPEYIGLSKRRIQEAFNEIAATCVGPPEDAEDEVRQVTWSQRQRQKILPMIAAVLMETNARREYFEWLVPIKSNNGGPPEYWFSEWKNRCSGWRWQRLERNAGSYGGTVPIIHLIESSLELDRAHHMPCSQCIQQLLREAPPEEDSN